MLCNSKERRGCHLGYDQAIWEKEAGDVRGRIMVQGRGCEERLNEYGVEAACSARRPELCCALTSGRVSTSRETGHREAASGQGTVVAESVTSVESGGGSGLDAVEARVLVDI